MPAVLQEVREFLHVLKCPRAQELVKQLDELKQCKCNPCTCPSEKV